MIWFAIRILFVSMLEGAATGFLRASVKKVYFVSISLVPICASAVSATAEQVQGTRRPGDTQETPRMHSGAARGTQETPRRHPAAARRHPGDPGGAEQQPGDTQEHPECMQETPRGPPKAPRAPEAISIEKKWFLETC